MTKTQVNKEIKRLRAELEEHNRLYYTEAKPSISDFEYDKLLKRLIDLEEQFPDLKTSDSPSVRVGGAPLKSFQSVKHSVPMLSLDNTYSFEELADFDERVKKNLGMDEQKENQDDLFGGVEDQSIDYYVEEKIDGVSISLRYEKGVLVRATSRGDGETGDDITENIKTIGAIPLKIPVAGASYKGKVPGVLEVRGEAYISRKQFEKINETKKERGEDLFANPRNACAGTLKMLDSKVVAERKLDAFIHGLAVLEGGSSKVASQSDAFELFEALGFVSIPNKKLCHGLGEVKDFIVSVEKKRPALNYDIDGMVVKVDSLSDQKQLGATTKAPRWMIAYKYAAEKAQTEVQGIRIQVGRTGVLTPVADLQPVLLCGSTVSRASLHNQDEIERLDVRVGDQVLIEKSGEIIPKVIEVLAAERKGKLSKFKFPTKCPVCDGEVCQDKDVVAIRCVNPNCPAKLKARIRHFAQRSAMDIEGLGAMWVDQFVDKGWIKDLADIYYMKREDIVALERMGEKSTDNLLAGIEKSKQQFLHRLIFGLGIDDVGEKAAYILAQRYRDLEALAAADKEELENIHEMGPVTAESIYSFFHLASTQLLLDKLKQVGVRFDHVEEGSVGGTVLANKVVVVTGTLETLGRKEAESLVRKHGGNATGSVSKKTDYLVVGESPGSKLAKAEKLGVTVLSESDFLKLIKEEN